MKEWVLLYPHIWQNKFTEWSKDSGKLYRNSYQNDHQYITDEIKNCMGSSIKYVRKIFRKTSISNPLIRT